MQFGPEQNIQSAVQTVFAMYIYAGGIILTWL